MRLSYPVTLGVALLAAAFATFAHAYDEPDAVKARFPDPPVQYQTPAFAPGRGDFTTHEELMIWLADLTARAASVRVRVLGESQEGRAIPMLVLSNAPVASPADVLRLNRPVVWLQGLQHGDEPAGGEAMLAIAAESFVIRMAQPNALLAAVALEPESASSFVTIGAIPVDKAGTVEGASSEVPIYRLAVPVTLALTGGEP